MFGLLSLGQLGILLMIGISVPGDLAYYTYYAGMVLVMLWASFVFLFNLSTALYFTISTIVLYNLTVFVKHLFFPFPFTEQEQAYLINNNFFLFSAAILVIIGANQLDRQGKEIKKVHNELLLERDQLEIAKEKAQESDHLKSAFLANMSHEIRTPLNSIIGFSELMTDPDFEQEQLTKFSEIIHSSGNSLLSIISDIMDISKIEAGQLQLYKSVVSAKQLIANIHQEYVFQAEAKGIELRIDPLTPDTEILFESDENRIRQVLVNFVANAIKFTKKGFVEIGIRNMDDSIQFHVKDTGIGIAKDFHDKIFERFRQVESSFSREFGGTGLGLSISKSLVELLGGRIGLESEPGQGSMFYFNLPK
jgi:signal transduction histidine kinase